MDPLSFHDGKVATIGKVNKAVHQAIPTVGALTLFLRQQRMPLLIQQTFFVVFLTISLTYIIVMQVPTASNRNATIFGVATTLMILLFLALVTWHNNWHVRVHKKLCSNDETHPEEASDNGETIDAIANVTD